MNYDDVLAKAFEKREVLFSDENTSCFRLFNSSGDGIDGLTIDYYDGFCLVQYLDSAAKELILSGSGFEKMLVKNIGRFATDIHGCLVKNRTTVKGKEDYNAIRQSVLLFGKLPPDEFVVKQNGVRVEVDLVDGQSTGVFLDMREVRDSLLPFYKDMAVEKMLNLFSYTCMFSAHALKNGVGSCVNVDLSRAVLRRGQANYSHNSIKYDSRDFICDDSMSVLNYFAKKNRRFDFAVIDPPTFSRNRKKTFSVKRNYPDLLSGLGNLTGEGFVLSAVNSHSVTEKEYRSYHPSGWELLSIWTESMDFPWGDRPYLKTALWKIPG